MTTRRQFLTGVGVLGAQAMFARSLVSLAAPQAALTPAIGQGRASICIIITLRKPGRTPW